MFKMLNQLWLYRDWDRLWMIHWNWHQDQNIKFNYCSVKNQAMTSTFPKQSTASNFGLL